MEGTHEPPGCLEGRWGLWDHASLSICGLRQQTSHQWSPLTRLLSRSPQCRHTRRGGAPALGTLSWSPASCKYCVAPLVRADLVPRSPMQQPQPSCHIQAPANLGDWV